MSYDYDMRITIGVPLSEGQVRNCDTRHFHDFVEEQEVDHEYTLWIKGPDGIRIQLEDTGERSPSTYYLGIHHYGSDWRRDPQEMFLSYEYVQLNSNNMFEMLQEALEPLGLWNPKDFGIHVWASVG